MLKELWESFKRQWKEWKVLRWWTRKRASHYVKEDDTEIFKNLAEILGKSTVGLEGFVVHRGVEKIKLFGRAEICDYQIRTQKSSIVVDVNLMPFNEELRILDNNLWYDLSSNDILIRNPMYGSSNTSNRTIKPLYFGTHVILITGKVQESTTIHNHIQWMMEYFMNLEIEGLRVADTPITNPIYAKVSDIAILKERLSNLTETWNQVLETRTAQVPEPEQENIPDREEPEPQKEEADEQPEVN